MVAPRTKKGDLQAVRVKEWSVVAPRTKKCDLGRILMEKM